MVKPFINDRASADDKDREKQADHPAILSQTSIFKDGRFQRQVCTFLLDWLSHTYFLIDIQGDLVANDRHPRNRRGKSFRIADGQRGALQSEVCLAAFQGLKIDLSQYAVHYLR